LTGVDYGGVGVTGVTVGEGVGVFVGVGVGAGGGGGGGEEVSMVGTGVGGAGVEEKLLGGVEPGTCVCLVDEPSVTLVYTFQLKD
jgi:hypothetical protein